MAAAISIARRRFLAFGGARDNPCAAARFLLHGFCSAADQSPDEQVSGSPDPAPPPTEEGEERRGRRRPTGSAPVHETICYMMAKRPWTTRLQNSIRSLCPTFDQELVLAVVRGAREPDRALRFFRWVEKTGFRHSAAVYGEIVRLLTRHRMLNHARCLILEDMPKRGLQPDERMLAALIEGYGLAGIPQEVVKIFGRMPELGVERGIRSYEAFFKAILRSGRAMMAKRYFNQMLRDGVEPTLFTFNILIWGFCLCQRMSTAARFFSDMKARGISPDVVTYNTLLGGWVRSGKLEDAQKVFDELAPAGLAPNSISYSLLIKGRVAAGQAEDALRLYAEMSDKGIRPTEQTYAALLPGLCGGGAEGGRLGDAKKLLDEMAERQIALREGSVLLKLISCFCEAGRVDEALQLVQTMETGLKARPNLSHFDVLIASLCRESRFDRAAEMAGEIVEKGLLLDPRGSSASQMMSPAAYNPVIEYMCSNGSTRKAEVLFRQLMKKGVEDPAAFNHLIRGHSRENTPESAADILAIVGRRAIAVESDAYGMLAESFLRRGDPAAAKTTLDGMIEQGHLPSPQLFRSVMAALFEDGRVQTASRLMRSMIEKGVKENLDLAHKILETLLSRGHVEEALGRIEMLRMNECAPNTDELLLALCDKRKTIPALKLAEYGLEAGCEIEFSTYDRVLDALTEEGKTMKAYALLCKIKKKGGVTDHKGCRALIKSLVEEGKAEQADALYRLVFGRAREKAADEAC